MAAERTMRAAYQVGINQSELREAPVPRRASARCWWP